VKFRFNQTELIYSFTDLFNVAMNRNVKFHEVSNLHGKYLNLGAGEKNLAWAKSLQLPEWNAETQNIPERDESVDGIVAFHFFEHISSGRIPKLLIECERVMRFGAILTIAVPHRLGGMAYQDLDHKSFFTEDTWHTLMNNDYYGTKWEGSRLKMHFNIIAGDSERTLMLFTQFTKEVD